VSPEDRTMKAPAILMYTRVFCGYCAAARSLLNEKQVAFDEIDVTINADRRREMVEKSGRSSVPQIFFDEQHIGGYDDLAKLDSEGRLDKLLRLTE
jgi:glutaredoxin 3